MKIYPNAVRLTLQEHASVWIAQLAEFLHALFRIPSQIRGCKLLQAFESWLDRYPLVRELLSEARSFVCRIQMLCRESLWRDGVDLGRVVETEPDANGYLLPCIETERRSLSIEMLQSKCPWVSAMDMQFFLFGFEAAGSTPSDSSCSKSQFRISLFAPRPEAPQ
jgi:hypothetical protein